jgi:DNA polymerase III delta prime subunit
MVPTNKKCKHLAISGSDSEGVDQKRALRPRINTRSSGSSDSSGSSGSSSGGGENTKITSFMKKRAAPLLAESFSDGFQGLFDGAGNLKSVESGTRDPSKSTRESGAEIFFDLQGVRAKRRSQAQTPVITTSTVQLPPRKRKLERYSTVTGAGSSTFSFLAPPLPAKKTNSMPSFAELGSSGSQNSHSSSQSHSLKEINNNNKEDTTTFSDMEENGMVPWVEKHAPRSTPEVALHVRKLADTRQALKEMLKPHAVTRLLILSGPAGASKSTVVRMLAREVLACRRSGSTGNVDHGHESGLLEWENPDSLPGRSLPTAFQEFLSSARYRSNKDTIVMIDDLPMLSHRATKEFFNSTLLNWVNQPPDDYADSQYPGVVLIMTEVEVSSAGSVDEGSAYSFRNADSLVTERVLWPQLLRHPAVRRLKFNPVSKTLLTKALKSVIEREPAAFRWLAPAERQKAVDVLAAGGDVRSAITALEYWAVGRTRALAAAASDRSLGIEARGGTDVYLTMLRRDAHLDLFHAVGKVIYRSSKDKLGQAATPDDSVVAGIVTDWSSSRGDQQILSGTVFENYLSTSGHLPLAAVGESLEALCISDLLTGRRQNYGGAGNLLLTQLACELDVRGVRHTMKVNEHLKATTAAGSSSSGRPAPMRFTNLFKRRSEAVVEYELAIRKFQDEHPRSGAESIMVYEKYYTDFVTAATAKRQRARDYYEKGLVAGAVGSSTTPVSSLLLSKGQEKLLTPAPPPRRVPARAGVSFSVAPSHITATAATAAVAAKALAFMPTDGIAPSAAALAVSNNENQSDSDWGSEFATDNEFDREVEALAREHQAQQQQAQQKLGDRPQPLNQHATTTSTNPAVTAATTSMAGDSSASRSSATTPTTAVTTTTTGAGAGLDAQHAHNFDFDDDDLDDFFDHSF